MTLQASTYERQISLANLPPTPRQTRSALAGAAALLLGSGVLAPFAGIQLPRVNGFIPALDATIFVTDLITAGLLFAHFSITRSRALLVLACGYLFSALIVVAHGLSYPEAFLPTENLSRILRINYRLYLFWHLGLPATLFAYVWLRDKDRTKAGADTPTVFVAIYSVAGVLALVSCLAWFAAAGDEILPFPLNNLDRSSPLAPWVLALTILISAVALSVLWSCRRSALDQWLMVVVLASMVEMAITALFGGLGPRSTLGFYTGRVFFSLLTSTVVVTALLAETTKLYARLAHANMLVSVVKASQELSSEIVLPKFIEQLMKIAIENAGADRGLLILPSGKEYLIQAEARATGDRIGVTMRQEPIARTNCPESLVRYVIRTRESVILDDASMPNLFSGDDYRCDRRLKSILCLPLIKQRELTGVLLLENTLTSYAFTPARIAVLELLAAQAAISLENTRLYTDLQLQIGLLQKLPVSAWTLKPDGTPDFVNRVWLEFAGQTLDFVRSHPEAWMTAVHPEDREIAAKSFWEGVNSGQGFAMETRSLRARDGTYRWHLNQAVVLRDSEGKVLKFVGTTTDIDEQKSTGEALRQAQAELAHVTRLTTMGELTASIAHEVNQPLAAVVNNANACLALLPESAPQNQEIRNALAEIVDDADRASAVISRVRQMVRKTPSEHTVLKLREVVADVFSLARQDTAARRVATRIEFAEDMPPVKGDRVQLQQVLLNLVVNGMDAMSATEESKRILTIWGRHETRDGESCCLLGVQDIGVGFKADEMNHLFEAFYTTKPEGMGMGLAISRSIIEAHDGRLWAEPNQEGPGATFLFSLPDARKASS
jgi:PAS domain S-box-containing protein